MKPFWLALFMSTCASIASSAHEAVPGPSDKYDFVVAIDGSGDFTTVQSAINAVPDYRRNPTTTFIRNASGKFVSDSNGGR
jgi:hypothetical protein